MNHRICTWVIQFFTSVLLDIFDNEFQHSIKSNLFDWSWMMETIWSRSQRVVQQKQSRYGKNFKESSFYARILASNDEWFETMNIDRIKNIISGQYWQKLKTVKLVKLIKYKELWKSNKLNIHQSRNVTHINWRNPFYFVKYDVSWLLNLFIKN